MQGGYDTATQLIEEHSEAMVNDRRDAAGPRDPGRQPKSWQIIRGETLPPVARDPKDSADHTQQVMRPEGGRRVPGLSEGERPQPA